VATKKQKRARALAKRQEFMETVKQTGLEALRKDQEHRRRKELEAWEKQHETKHSWKKRIKECPHCRIEMAAGQRNAESLEDSAAS